MTVSRNLRLAVSRILRAASRPRSGERPTRPDRRRHGVAIAAIACGALVAGAVGSASVTPASAATVADAPTSLNGYRNVGYFAQWGVYGRDFKLKQLQESGSAADLTHINYSFGNIHNETLKCFVANKAQGEGPNGSDGAGDAYADYGMSYTAATSVNGTADSWDQPLAGSFNQLKQLKALHPGLKPMISLGGWTWSKNFSRAAATDASRKTLVSSCIDLYIKGNLPVIDGRGGAGAGAGVFDGIDIDWEWPGSPNGNAGNGVDAANDRNNFRLLLKEFRTQLDAYSATTGKAYTLSAFLPANPADISAGGWNDPELFSYLDFGNVQGYDFWGGWAPTQTGHQGNLYDDPSDTRPAAQRFSVQKAVAQYTSAGIPPAKLGLGLAMYGRGWQGAPSQAPWGPATSTAPGRYEAGNNNYDDIRTLGTDYFDAAVGAAWRYDGSQWWSYDSPRSVDQKAKWIVATGLGGAMWWDLSGNRDGSLMDSLTAVLRSAPTGPVTVPGNPPVTPPVTPPTNPPTNPPACSTAAWVASQVYTAGNTASSGGVIYTAQWWTQGETPGTAAVWRATGTCTAGQPPTQPATPAWSSSAAYSGGARVTHAGVVYVAKWWTQGDVPGASASGPWARA
jgi:chitinase